jgi:hypothetical protein
MASVIISFRSQLLSADRMLAGVELQHVPRRERMNERMNERRKKIERKKERK